MDFGKLNGLGPKAPAPHGRQNFIDRWVDNKSYQYCFSVYEVILKKSISTSLRCVLR